jgi:hypothetical protein
MLVFQTQVGKNVNTFFLFKIGSIANGSFFSWVGGHVAIKVYKRLLSYSGQAFLELF